MDWAGIARAQFRMGKMRSVQRLDSYQQQQEQISGRPMNSRRRQGQHVVWFSQGSLS